MGIYDFYFNSTAEIQEKYGNRSVVFMLVGGFYEIYGLMLKDGNYNTNLYEVSQICGIVVKPKENVKKNIFMAGFPDYALDKFLKFMINDDYTVAIYDQLKEGKLVTRHLSRLCSKGTIIDNIETTNTTNNVACIWCEEYTKTENRIKTKKIVFGLCVANIMNGDTNVFEYSQDFMMNPTLVDELERQLTIFNPNEYIFISNLSSDQDNKILQYLGLANIYVHTYKTDETHEDNCTKPKYINHCISEEYGEDAKDICIELNQYMMSSQALVFLIEFLRSHNPHLIEKIRLPSFTFKEGYVLLANHTLKQLNIIKDNQSTGKYSSVSTFMNNCKTKSGKRAFYNNLLNPTNNIEWLQNEYEMNSFYKTNFYGQDARNMLNGIHDIELIIRHCIDEKCTPQMFCNLYNSIVLCRNIVRTYQNCHKMLDYLGIKKIKKLDDCIEFLESTLYTQNAIEVTNITNTDDNIFHKGVYNELDELLQEHKKHNEYFQSFLKALNNSVLTFDKVEYFKVNEKDKKGNTIIVTKTRSEKFKSKINMIKVNNKEIPINEIDFIIQGKFMEVYYPALQTSIIKSQQFVDKIVVCLKECFLNFMKEFVQKYHGLIEELTNMTSKLDVLQTRIYNAEKYNYCLPLIKNTQNDSSYIDAMDMRHCLIEHLQQNEIYVPNDVCLGKDETRGMLLYGTNAVGKTSLIRALGICVILAQSGNYVPCSAFTYYPYNSVFSRILGNDNIFKGLSTFAVEMSELRVILNNSDSRSLILGDELCSGTEIESALSIFMAGIEYIHSKSSTYIFATHFHEILEFDELSYLKGLLIRHMDVYYDNELQELIYNRKLKEGSGSKYYGLEVCKSMYMKPEFLERAYQLRTKHFWGNKSLLESSKSTYNSNKLKHTCELCGNPAQDIHHMLEQHKADDNEFIGHFHKNHKANLMALCKECHVQTHKNETEYVRKKTSSGYKVFEKSS